MGGNGTRYDTSTAKVGEGLGGGQGKGVVANGRYLVPEGYHDQEE